MAEVNIHLYPKSAMIKPNYHNRRSCWKFVRHPQVVNLLRDRRGVTALIFALSAAALLGAAGLATEVGSWYLIRARAANAADAAALAGALQAAAGGNVADVEAAANDAMSLNGFAQSASTQSPGAPSADIMITGALMGRAATAPASASGSGNAVTITASNPPRTGSYAGDNAATEVVVNIRVAPLFARLFTNQTPVLTARAVGRLEMVGNACALSLTGPLVIQQPQNATSFGSCYYASNATGTGAVTIAPAATIAAWGISTTGDCTNCPVPQSPLFSGNDAEGTNVLYRPNSSYQPPTTNPYTTIDAQIAPNLPISTAQITCIPVPGTSGNTCLATRTAVQVTSGALVPSTGDGDRPSPTCVPGGTVCAYYNMDITIPAGGSVTMPPGTYFFINSSLDIEGALQCMTNNAQNQSATCDPNDTSDFAGGAGPVGTFGVTIVLTGSAAAGVGSLTIGPGATVILSAPACATYPAASPGSCASPLNGILFYRDPQGLSGTTVSPVVRIADSAGNSVFNGGLYFPNAYVAFAANNSPSLVPACTILVAGFLTLGPAVNQANPSQFGIGSCSAYNTAMPNVQQAEVVE
jgi:Flp pilus assembly protein TadG